MPPSMPRCLTARMSPPGHHGWACRGTLTSLSVSTALIGPRNSFAGLFLFAPAGRPGQSARKSPSLSSQAVWAAPAARRGHLFAVAITKKKGDPWISVPHARGSR